MPVIGSNQEIIKEYLGPSEIGRVYLGNNLVQNGTIPFITATGGTITEDGDFKIHTFTTVGTSTFTINNLSFLGFNSIDYLIVGGGGGGLSALSNQSGGGGAGGTVRTGSFSAIVGAYPAIVAAGGIADFGVPGVSAPPDCNGGAGGTSSIFNINATGGNLGCTSISLGAGISNADFSGGGTSQGCCFPSFGFGTNCGGGAGAGGNGVNANTSGNPPVFVAGDGGIGVLSSISGVSTYYGGGGGGAVAGETGGNVVTEGFGGLGGGGKGALDNSSLSTAGTNGLGGGGGGGRLTFGANRTMARGSNGGSGIVIVRYRFK